MGTEQLKKNRIEYIDVARGITMIMIVIVHVIGETNLTYHHFITSMGLQMFLFTCGYFFRGFKIKNNITKLVFPFAALLVVVRLVWNIRLNMWELGQIKDVVKQIVLGDTFDKLWQGQGVFVGIAWFLPMLVAARLIYDFICKIEKENYVIRGVIVLFVSCVGILIGSHGYELPWAFDVAMASVFFVYLGDFSNKYRDKVEAIYNKVWFIPASAILWGVVVHFYGFGELTFRTYPSGITYLLSSSLSLFIVLAVCYFICNHFRLLTIILKTYGKYTFAILVGHVIDKSCIIHSPDTNIYLLALIELFLASVPMFILLIFNWVKGRIKNERVE